MEKPAVDWYFDVISPFAYLAAERLHEVERVATVRCVPLLFAGLLDRWGTKGPAEVEPKRRFTYRYACWAAARRGIAFKAPPAHPFNPIPLLRLAVAAGPGIDTTLELFRFVWRDGLESGNVDAWRQLAARMGVAAADVAITRPEVKARLKTNGEQATARGVFGVPTFVTADGELFWGEDATDMILDYLAQAPIFRSEEMRRADDMPMAAQRIPLVK